MQHALLTAVQKDGRRAASAARRQAKQQARRDKRLNPPQPVDRAVPVLPDLVHWVYGPDGRIIDEFVVARGSRIHQALAKAKVDKTRGSDMVDVRYTETIRAEIAELAETDADAANVLASMDAERDAHRAQDPEAPLRWLTCRARPIDSVKLRHSA